MLKKTVSAIAVLCIFSWLTAQPVIRINQLGYAPGGVKVAVWASRDNVSITSFYLVNAATNRVVFTGKASNNFGAYGPFTNTYRLNFSSFRQRGSYYLRAGNITSPVFKINEDVYNGAADFCLRYMRQQRSGFNPFLKDSCHTQDGYTLYGPMPDSTHINVVGGWHDASDYLQYSTTSANATYHLLAAYRDFPGVFTDRKQANGLDGKNGLPDVLDEAKWGLDWLLKMHPKDDWMFNQVGDDRDHRGMRIPKEDYNFYGRGNERPVYFCNGLPQQRGRFTNNTTGVASTAGKFASAFALGSRMFTGVDATYAAKLSAGAVTALQMGISKPGACQTASVLSPYIYAEDNWTDDMELATAAIYKNGIMRKPFLLDSAYNYALQEKITPWLGADTAKHYQWYPFINLGHYELATALAGSRKDSLVAFYKAGINRVWKKARDNAFYRGIPFIWCSNNLTVSFAIQCYWYRQLTRDETYLPLEQACFDWVFGCNPWGTSMVYGLPQWGDTPADPHSAFTHLKGFPIDGGLVDGPVYTSIYSNLIGIQLHDSDEYAPFQSKLAVYHDDYGDYSTNEPTMDGTASLIYLLAAQQAQANNRFTFDHGGIVRGDSTKHAVALVFTGDEFGDGLPAITATLQSQSVQGSFFLTGRFYSNKQFTPWLQQLYKNGNYMSTHSGMHLLYNDWNNRDSLLVTKQVFLNDLHAGIAAIKSAGIDTSNIHCFIPPYEWWNDSIAAWGHDAGLQVVCFTPGVRTNADYTYPGMAAYKTSDWIMQSIHQLLANNTNGLNGAIILIHAGTDERRKDKLYNRLDELITTLKEKGYAFKKIDALLQ
ncbi:MAG TPA: glycoside hydrolase family 9 protein [Chitinophagaceae bacterium]|nr:glycoside hydrolase family 9 protein [Chitinophagaceae bacterium]